MVKTLWLIVRIVLALPVMLILFPFKLIVSILSYIDRKSTKLVSIILPEMISEEECCRFYEYSYNTETNKLKPLITKDRRAPNRNRTRKSEENNLAVSKFDDVTHKWKVIITNKDGTQYRLESNGKKLNFLHLALAHISGEEEVENSSDACSYEVVQIA